MTLCHRCLHDPDRHVEAFGCVEFVPVPMFRRLFRLCPCRVFEAAA